MIRHNRHAPAGGAAHDRLSIAAGPAPIYLTEQQPAQLETENVAQPQALAWAFIRCWSERNRGVGAFATETVVQPERGQLLRDTARGASGNPHLLVRGHAAVRALPLARQVNPQPARSFGRDES